MAALRSADWFSHNIDPMLATLVDEPFDDEAWSFESKWDGVRTLAYVDGSTYRLATRAGKDATRTYPEIGAIVDALAGRRAIIDGEICAFENGIPSFHLLQTRISLHTPRAIERAAKATPVVYVLFDLLYLDGTWLMDLPLTERLARMEEVLRYGGAIARSASYGSNGAALFREAARRGLEGIIGKRLGSPYQAGKRTRDWLKVKAVAAQEFVVGGWTEGTRPGTIGSLVLGVYDGGTLVHVGNVGSGLDAAARKMLEPLVHRLATQRSPFGELSGADAFGPTRWVKRTRTVHWLRPELVAEVEHRGWPEGGQLRQPSFKGLRDEKDPKTIVRERPV